MSFKIFKQKIKKPKDEASPYTVCKTFIQQVGFI